MASGDTAAARRLLLQARAAATPALKPRLALAEGFLLEAEGRADTALLRYGEAAAGGDAATRSAAYGRMALSMAAVATGTRPPIARQGAWHWPTRWPPLSRLSAWVAWQTGVGLSGASSKVFLKNSVSTTSPRYGCM